MRSQAEIRRPDSLRKVARAFERRR
ncbi:MAG: hypothetical protein QOI08_581, partial [Actinomycetota bacterium]|nr:hypothetical protein [Actinomycetota bacterium]